MFYSRGAGNDLRWQLMPFVDADFGALGDSFTTSSGADCRLRNIAILRNTAQGAPMTVIVGERDFGRSYADAAPVKFVVYRIARNADGIPGFPAVYFRADRTIASRSNHCDVNEAFLAELGIRASVE
jgi:hypothetical protein